MKKILMAMAVAAATTAALTACSGGGKAKTEQTQQQAQEQDAEDQDDVLHEKQVSELKDDQRFRPGKKTGMVTVLDFSATWCMPCRRFAPVLEAAAEKYGNEVDFITVDIDENQYTAQAFGVTNVPTVIFLNADGDVIAQYVGTAEIGEPDQFFAIVEKYK